MDEKTQLLSQTVNSETGNWIAYKRRWYLLLVFSCLSCQQSVLWITFSPVADTTKQYYGWKTDFEVNLMLAWGPIIYIPFVFFTGWIMNLKGGLRRVIILGAILDGIGAGIRCLTILHPLSKSSVWIISIGQILNAAVGPLVMASPSKFSATWFKENERTTVTAIATLSNVLGNAVGFIYGPYVVKYTSMPMLLIVQAVGAGVIMIWVLIYFPSKPPTPPSPSAALSIDGTIESAVKPPSFLQEIVILCKHRSFMILSLVGGFSTGVFGAWSGMFDIILHPLGYSDTLAGWLGFSSTIAGIIGGVVLGLLGDTLFKRKFKILILSLFFISCLLFIYFSLALPSVFSPHPLVPSSKWIIIIAITLGGLFLGSTNPIFLELGAEMTFPVSEGSSAGVITLFNNIGSVIFLLGAPYIKYNWINSITTLSLLFCGVLMIFVKEEYLRKNFDNK